MEFHNPVSLVQTKKAKVSLCLAKHQAMKTYLGWRYSSTHSWPRH